MVAAAKKAAKKVTKAAKKTADKPDSGEAKAAREARDAELTTKIVSMREADEKWGEIVTALGISPGKAMFLYEVSQVKPKDRIKYDDDDDLAKQIVAARKDGQSWGTIMARANISEGKARGLWEAATNKSSRGERIGKGGRFPSDMTPPKKATKPTKKAVKKVAGAAKKAAPGDEVKNVNDMTLRELTDRLAGRKIKVGKTSISVREVTGLEDGDVEFVDAKNGAVRTVKVASINSISK